MSIWLTFNGNGSDIHNRRKQTSEPIKTHNKQSSKKCYFHWFDWTRNYSPQQTTFRSRSSATKTIPLEPSKLSYQLIENRHHKILVKFFNHTFSELTKSLGRSSSCEISISTSTLATKEPNRHRVNKSILELVRCKCFSSVFFFFFFFFWGNPREFATLETPFLDPHKREFFSGF